MGQSHSNYTHPVLNSNWIPLSHPTHIFAHVNPHATRTLRNVHTHQQIEEYLIEFASQLDFRHYAQQLRMRMQPSNDHIIQQSNPDSYYHLSPFIYTVRYFVNNTLQDICATSYKGLLYAKKVDLRLKQINDIPLSDQLYLTKATLQGFKVLYEKQGYFDITEQMIFISKEGQVRVWINSNLSKNEAMYIPHKVSRDAQGSQSEMIVQLLDLIQQNTDSQEQEVVHFKQYLTKKGVYNRLSFYRAVDEFETYCLEERLLVEDGMRSIYELYHMEQAEDSHIMEVSSRMHEQLGVKRQVQQKCMHDNSPTSMQLQLPLAQMNERKQLMESRISNHSERNSRSQHHVQLREETNRVRSITTHSYKQQQELSFKNSGAPPTSSYQSQKTSQMPIQQNLYFNHYQSQKEVVPALPTPTFGLPTINTRYQHRSTQHNNNPPAVIRFNYVPHRNLTNTRSYQQPITHSPSLIPKQPITPKISVMTLPHDMPQVESIRVESRVQTRQSIYQSVQVVKAKNTPEIKYYTSDEIYTLDRQIAEDLQKYLGFNLNS